MTVSTARFDALTLIAGGLLSAATVTLYVMGRQREAAVLTVTGALLGTVVGVAKLYSTQS